MKRIIVFIGVVALAAASSALAQTQFPPGMRSIKIAVSDFEKSAAFYTALGMSVGTKRDTTWDLVWEVTTRNSGIVLASPEYAKRANMVPGGTYFMITTPDVKAIADKLRQAGYPDVGEPRAMGTLSTVLMLNDPDGNRIELLGPLPGKE